MPVAFGKYNLLKRLAVGGMAEVFLGVARGSAGFKKYVAIKRILPDLASDAEFVHMFLDEARILAQFSHPNIVQIYDLGRLQRSYFLAMEYIHGISMDKLLKLCKRRGQKLPIEYAAKIVSDACDALDYAHGFAGKDGTPLNLVHRDVNPQNVMLSTDGVVKVLDFGVAKAVGNLTRTRPSSLKGKVMYMSPEQISKPDALDRRSDIFALGTMLYVLATGRSPFEGRSEMDVMLAVANKPVPDPQAIDETIPDEFCRIVRRAMEKDPDKRYPTARAMRADLERFIFNRQLMVDKIYLSRFLLELLPRKKKKTTAGTAAQQHQTGSRTPATHAREPEQAAAPASRLPREEAPVPVVQPAAAPAAVKAAEPVSGPVVAGVAGEALFSGITARRKLPLAWILVALLLAAGLVAVFIAGAHTEEPAEDAPAVAEPAQRQESGRLAPPAADETSPQKQADEDEGAETAKAAVQAPARLDPRPHKRRTDARPPRVREHRRPRPEAWTIDGTEPPLEPIEEETSLIEPRTEETAPSSLEPGGPDDATGEPSGETVLPEGPREELVEQEIESEVPDAEAAPAEVAGEKTAPGDKAGSHKAEPAPVLAAAETRPTYQPPEVVRKRRIAGREPVYPPIALRAGLEATVLVKVHIDAEGKVHRHKFLKTSPYFEDAVVEALQTWQFSPHKINDRPVGTYTVYKFVFERD